MFYICVLYYNYFVGNIWMAGAIFTDVTILLWLHIFPVSVWWYGWCTICQVTTRSAEIALCVASWNSKIATESQTYVYLVTCNATCFYHFQHGWLSSYSQHRFSVLQCSLFHDKLHENVTHITQPWMQHFSLPIFVCSFSIERCWRYTMSQWTISHCHW